jgi:hypothetical protein
MGVSVHLGAYTLSWSTSMEFVSLFHPPLTIELGLTDVIRRFAPPNALMRMRGEMARMENKTSRSWRAVKSAFSA